MKKGEMDKYRKLKFERSFSTYNEFSQIQKKMATELFSLLSQNFRPSNVFELGCGTGHLTGELINKFPQAKFLITDLSLRMVKGCRENLQARHPRANWACLDAEKKFPCGQDLICGNALVQWLEDLDTHFQNAKESLKPGGKILFSGFSDENFKELRSILIEEPFHIQHLPGWGWQEIQAKLKKAGFEIEASLRKDFVGEYPSAYHFLRALKGLGAGGRPDFPISRRMLERLYATYGRRFSAPGGVRATWSYWCLCARQSNLKSI